MRRISGWLVSVVALAGVLLGMTGCVNVNKADFSLSASPATLSVVAGSTGQLSLTITPLNGFSQNVNVTVSGLPVGVTASPATFTLATGKAQTLALTAASSTAVGNSTVTFTGVSGTVTHTATVALAITAAPPAPMADFSLAVSPTSETIAAGTSGAQLTLLATPVNGFNGTVAVALSNLPVGVTASPTTLNLTAGASQKLTLTAAANAASSTGTVTFTGTSGSLSHTATLALTVTAVVTAPPPPPAATGPDVTTYHYDNTREGLNAQETTLTPTNVNSTEFGLRKVYTVDGVVDAQPLYVGGLMLGTGTQAHTANVLYVVTEHDSVYALDAATGAQEWKTSVLGTGETTSDTHNCNQITPEIGITSTPVIDRTYGAHGSIFVVGMTKDASGGYHQRLHALDLTTGAELAGSPTEITATYPGTGVTSAGGVNTFDPGQYAERVGLLLQNKTIYTAWTSHCDIEPYSGWVMGYSETSLKQSTVLNLTPNGNEGSIWMAGYGLAADVSGNIYFLDANGSLDSGFTNGFPSQADYGNALVKLSTANGLAVSDYFEPYNTVNESTQDVDLGSGGAMLLPDVKDSAGTVRHLVVGAGKDGNIYVGDRDNLGKFNQSAQNNSNLYQELANALPSGAWSGPAYFNNTVFYGGVGDVLKAYSVSNALLSTSPTSESATTYAYPGSTPSVSANGSQNGILWATESATDAAAVLHAYDATNLGHELYNSKQAANGRDGFGTGNKFITPMVTNGLVFVGTPNGVAVFGLLNP